jgi:transposase
MATLPVQIVSSLKRTLPFLHYSHESFLFFEVPLIEMLSQHMAYFRIKPEHLPKTTILLDHGYHLDKVQQALERVYPQVMSKIQFQLSPKPSKAEKAAAGKTGFVPVKARWVVERSNAWMERCKSLVKNFERTLANANALLNLCFIRLMLKRLAATA